MPRRYWLDRGGALDVLSDAWTSIRTIDRERRDKPVTTLDSPVIKELLGPSLKEENNGLRHEA